MTPRVISRNRTRFPKEIKAARGNNHPVIIKEWPEPMDETLGIVTELRDYADMGVSYNDMAVLYRGAESTVKFLMGDVGNITCINAYVDQDENLVETLERYFAQVRGGQVHSVPDSGE